MTILVFLGSTEALLRTFGHSGLLPSGYVGTFTSNALAEDAVVALSPVLAVIPFSGVYVDDLKSKFARFLLLRSSYFDYLISRILIAFFCGGGSIAFGCLSAWGISALVFFPTQLAGEADWVVVNLVVHKLILLFCNGGLWAVIGLSLSTVMESKYVAYISPFIVYYLLVILYERYFPDAWLVQQGIDLVTGIGSAIITALPYLAEAGFNIVVALGSALWNADWAAIGSSTISTLKNGLDVAAGEILGTDGNIIQGRTEVRWDGGIERVEIIPRWWTL